MPNRKEIVEEARSWLNVQWRHQGRTRENGIDCAGLVIIVARKLDLSDFNTTNYPRRPDGTFLKYFDEHMVKKLVKDAEDGDVLVFSRSGYPCHCGFKSTYRSEPSIIHAHARRRKVIEESLLAARGVIGPPTHCYAFPEV